MSRTDLSGLVLAGRYRIDAPIGRGGMGAVYAAEDVELGRQVAIKVLLPELSTSSALRRRFEREALAAGFLHHPNIVETYELSSVDGAMFLVMERVAGSALTDLIAQGPLAPALALAIARQCLAAIGFAHQHGLVHRDVKPDNILVTADGSARVKIVDFGVVKLLAIGEAIFGAEALTTAGVTFGTPCYIAPEQALGTGVDGRADLYSIGVILFEMLAGQPPFAHPDPMTLVRMQITAPPPRLSTVVGAGASWCTPEVDDAVARALAKRPDQRFAGAREMSVAIERALARTVSNT